MQVVFYGYDSNVADEVDVALRIRWPSLRVTWVTPGSHAPSSLGDLRADLAVIGPMALRQEGADLVRQTRRGFDGVIIALSREPSDRQLLEMLDAGADDYLPASVGPARLVARVCAALRRARPDPVSPEAVATCGSLTIDAQRHEAYVGAREVYLTPTEFKLLYHLAANRGTLVTQEALHDLIWGCEQKLYIETLRKHIERLRRKIHDSPDSDIRIVSVPRLGYKLLDCATVSPAGHSYC